MAKKIYRLEDIMKEDLIIADRNKNIVDLLKMPLLKLSTKKHSKLLSKEDFKNLMTF